MMSHACTSYFLDNYHLDNSDIWKCVKTGLSGNSYANQHWTLATKNPRYSSYHKVIAYVEYVPIIGGLCAVLERVIAYICTKFNTQPSIPISPQALEFILGVNPVPAPPKQENSNPKGSLKPDLYDGIRLLKVEEAQIFLNLGGSLNLITESNRQQIILRKEEQVITGCTSGLNRSQVAAAVLLEQGITIKAILAGGDSAMNPDANSPGFARPSEMNIEKKSPQNFTEAFKRNHVTNEEQRITKADQLGYAQLNNYSYTENQREIAHCKKFYQKYIDELSPTHFITFGSSGSSVFTRLLNRPDSLSMKPGCLQGFTITHFTWGDEICHPPAGMDKYSVDAYQAYADKLRTCFVVVS